ncbi:MAG: M60 family metallopeptidase [Ruminococcus sp.]|nr:M60 family metallopeptidase [Ruminococcus sp.]
MKDTIRRRYLKKTVAFISALSIIGSFTQELGAFTALSYNSILAAAIDIEENEETTTDTEANEETITSTDTEDEEETTTDKEADEETATSTDTEEETTTTTDTGSEDETTSVTTTATTTKNSNKEVPVNPEADGKYSRIDISISNQYDFLGDVDVTVKVFKINSDSSRTEILNSPLKIKGEKNSILEVTTDYIENGAYMLEVTSPGFKRFEQIIKDFDNMICTVTVALGFCNGYTYTNIAKKDENDEEVYNPDGDNVIEKGKDENHPGAMIVGDINGDNEINKHDEIDLLRAIDYFVRNNEEYVDENGKKIYGDLNRDGKTDLADLTFFTKGYFDTRNWDTTAGYTTEISDKYKRASVKEEKIMEGTVSNGLKITDLFKTPTKSESEENTTDEQSPTDDKSTESEKEQPKVELQPSPVKVKKEDGSVVEEVPDISLSNPVGVSVELDNADLKEIYFGTNALEGELVVELAEAEIETSTAGTVNTLGLAFKDGEAHLNESNIGISIEDGNIALNLGNQVAVKKITLKITNAKNPKLAEIGTVEFLNGMEERVGAPAIDYPENLKIVQDNKAEDKYAKIIATWNPCVNIEGYEFEISTSSATKADGSFAAPLSGYTMNVLTSPTTFLQSEHGNFKLIKTNTTYYAHVRSVADGGEYKSSWSEYTKITTVSNNKPDKPDYVSAIGDYKSIKVSWGSDNTNSTESYSLYYKQIDKDTEYTKIDVGKTTSYLLTDLDDGVNEYEIYVVGHNRNGDSPESVHASTVTTSVDPIKMINYHVINRDENGVPGSSHITSVTRTGGDMSGNYKDVDSKQKRQQASEIQNASERNAALNANPLTAWGVVDGDDASYYAKKSWDDGGFNGLGSNGLTFEFDDEYEIGSFAVARPYGDTNFTYIKVRYWDANGKEYNVNNGGYFCNTVGKTDVNGKGYHMITLPQKIKAKKIQIGFGNAWVLPALIAISEIYFYEYDPTMDEIMNLYIDDLHTVLKDGVTQEMIDELRAKINAPDEVTNELNPNKAALERELETAEKILNAKQISKAITVHNSITTYDPVEKNTSRKYSGLNAWQPLGVSIGVNTEVTIYVGSPSKKTGDNTELRLICTQYNSESNGVTINGANLKVGANTFQLTAGNSIAGAEAGGALYIQHQGGADSKVYYSVRVTGGSEIPILDLYQITDHEERLRRATEYVETLDSYVANMEEEHNRVHKGATYLGKKNTKLDIDYNQQTCILGASDILCDKMMYSLPAPQILAGLGKGTAEQRAETLLRSMESMEEMLTLFYQHKGMSADATNVVDRIPNQHLNIRYQRMFQGAAMYAAGNHIGIQWGTAPSMVCADGVTSDENGKYVSGNYFGWGIAHEIGHNLNDSSYTVAEITNNYFSLLAQAQDKNEGSRLNYNNVFKKVSSGTKGTADQGTQLGMYWQLHLAYDKDYNYKTYNTNTEILNNLFYARMDTYSRNPSKAPAPYGISLTLSGGTDQQLMRLACAASEKNVLEFFERWGKTPDSDTLSYASQFPKEQRAIIYANEDSRVYSMTGESSMTMNVVEEIDIYGNKSSRVVGETKVIDDVKVNVGKGTEANKVTLTIDVSDKIKSEDILGYDIVRCTMSNGDVKETPIGFTRNPQFTDTVTTLNNRTVSYKVTLIDHYLHRSEVFSTEMVKIQHDGTLDKTHWTVSTSGLSAPVINEVAEELPCSYVVIDPATAVIDDNFETAYTPKVTNNNAEIIMNFNQSLVVTGMKCTIGNSANSVGEYKVYVKDDTTGEWIEVSSGELKGNTPIYFSNSDEKYISTYDTTAVKLQILNQNNKTISIAELDVLGVTGDNVDFRKDGETATTVFGLLSEDYKYGTREQDYIPKDSLVFTGSYKGNPAYNAVILYDEKGYIVGSTGVDDSGKSQQIILADVPDGAMITDVSNGTWVYWIEPEDIDKMKWPEKVKVELYRVNNAITNDGQRMVSDSLYETLPADKSGLSSITISGDRKYVINDTDIPDENTTEVNTDSEEITTSGDTE